ncbi:hypothetical protein CPB83DRAFT_862758 [Crepidotus variabilis]|uniref:Uncharacterized protein n=1 Tax=Crepidotus variabilis TaxID=179855 RepID=A0A9P6E6P7_9AGAR|nr:hypothetical protein CPB83DRAFT_862758 [Crepidotus variabilis]
MSNEITHPAPTYPPLPGTRSSSTMFASVSLNSPSQTLFYEGENLTVSNSTDIYRQRRMRISVEAAGWIVWMIILWSVFIRKTTRISVNIRTLNRRGGTADPSFLSMV